jgi:hypothetical protein
VVRLASGTVFGRLKGESDLVYVGSASRIRQRLEQHLRPRDDERDVGYRLQRVQREVGPLEVSWRGCGSHRDAKFEEGTILRRYRDQHIELPPLNRQEGGNKVQGVLEALLALRPDRRDALIAEALRRRADRG